ncbi:MAG: tRNA (guanosine(37)-N1)-methyltransferase TrmD [Fervidobacterium sp.]|uniref:tRNA (guanine-N(1)-)-methyltransferase n=1 Tax=Fervidobacterium gondwanense DSM 13020 TaxID=1121883 RepID=A0A1M7S653_FERGO|nr:tRNA (guanosine(37)-N1)-methyltransferase TrmD [Fervidobacterium gondwanense]UXF00882.1 tRNA (guanine-N1)-methyltransferase [Fervidobacterium riparium]SHN54149.1 tRNA (Guanine37-N(1)-) methyltransferase [Fervidobacterium gondwanense DSM 13020]
MRVGVVTIFPDFVKVIKDYGVIAQAVENGLIDIEIFNLRDFTTDKHKVVDDYPYGGGPGMVMKPEPFFRFFEFYNQKYGKPYVLLTTPQGKRLTNSFAQELASKEHILIICGRYEGIDERVSHFVDEEVSIGDYVLTGGELPAMVVIDVVSRFVSGVVEEESVKNDSFYNDLLDHPHYTRPREIEGFKVPEVLVSGNHEEVELWRRKESLKKTILKRPDLFMKHAFDDLDKKALISLFKELMSNAQ